MTYYEVCIDVAAPPDEAKRVVREFMLDQMPDVHFNGDHVPQAGTVKLLAASGPAGGNPLVRVRFRQRSHARQFLTLWYGVNLKYEGRWIESEINAVMVGPLAV